MTNYDNRYIGKRFGRWTVMDIDYEKTDQTNRVYYLCKCDCGTIKSVRKSHLIDGCSTSCGCIAHERARTRLIGERFGRLTVYDFSHINDKGDVFWECICDCGQTVTVCGGSLTSGNTKSCGCYNRELTIERFTKHGHSYERLYNIWNGMIFRCENYKSTEYDAYGGRGISVCEEWKDFVRFFDWAMNNGYDDNLTLDRINNDGDYCPDNCRWVDLITQANNRRTSRFLTYLGEKHTISEWARLLDVPYHRLRQRINRGNISDFADHFGIIDPNWHEG